MKVTSYPSHRYQDLTGEAPFVLREGSSVLATITAGWSAARREVGANSTFAAWLDADGDGVFTSDEQLWLQTRVLEGDNTSASAYRIEVPLPPGNGTGEGEGEQEDEGRLVTLRVMLRDGADTDAVAPCGLFAYTPISSHSSTQK
jgi:hypothetical protein